jgi:hypothetical protein
LKWVLPERLAAEDLLPADGPIVNYLMRSEVV